jgi:uncharacterized membrane protein YphA (DoxX/SURF4 family)
LFKEGTKTLNSMNSILWITQGILALMFIMAGIMKSTQPKEKLKASLPWASDYSTGTIKFIGISELAGGLGLILPRLTGILPALTPVAALALALVMVLAALAHYRRKEYKAIGFNAILFLAALFIAFGRF